MAATGVSDEVRGQSMSDLLKQLSDQTTTLVRDELELAKVELTTKARTAGIAGGEFGAAAVLGLFAFGALVATAILALATAVASWLAALIVAVVLACAGAALALAGRAKVRQAVPPVPQQTVESVKEDVRWTKARVQQARH